MKNVTIGQSDNSTDSIDHFIISTKNGRGYFSYLRFISFETVVTLFKVERFINFEKLLIDLHASHPVVVSGKPGYVITGEIHMSVTIGLSISKRHFR